jgi:hypothetical protein
MDPIRSNVEWEEFNKLIAQYSECTGVMGGGGGCACAGGCLGNHLALLRKKFDHHYTGTERWFSDQGHCSLLVRPGDSGRHGAPLNADNYWSGAQ